MATILLLALTVTLFASIFAFVTSFPSPPAQNNNQFQASLVFGSNSSGMYIAAVHILHLAGPVVAGNALIYLKSSVQPNAPEFASPYTVSSGLSGSSLWNLGQVWNLTFPVSQRPIATGNNITIYLVAGGSLLFSVILPGSPASLPPTVVATWISPAPPTIGQGFTVYATTAGVVSSVTVNLANVPGGPSTAQSMTQNSAGQWTYTLSSGASKNGTFYGFVTATGQYGQQAVGAVVIVVSTSGGTINGPFSVGVILIPSPANGNTTETVQAVVTYSGVLSPAANLNVTFTVITSPYVAADKWVGWAPSTTISGGTSVTVASKTTWLIPSPFTHPSVTAGTSFTVYANATVTGVGTVPGTLSFTPAYLSLSSSSGLIGASITATGSSFSANTAVTISVGGVVQTLSSCTSGTLSTSKLNVTTSSSGGFACTFTLAAGTPYYANNVVATAPVSGQNATASYNVLDWSISPLTPTSGRIGIAVNVTGVNFVASSSVALTFDSASVKVLSCTSPAVAGTSAVTATSSGGFTCKFAIPYGVSAGAGSLVAYDATGLQTASASFTVTGWTLTTSPTKLSHGTSQRVYVNGTGYAPDLPLGTTGSNVTVTLNGTLLTSSTLTCTVGTITGSSINTTYGGSFSCYFTMGKAGAAAVYTFVATDYTSGQVATAVFERT